MILFMGDDVMVCLFLSNHLRVIYILVIILKVFSNIIILVHLSYEVKLQAIKYIMESFMENLIIILILHHTFYMKLMQGFLYLEELTHRK
jgi:phosphotransferase system  glucose/maltose/N-acetylglucosamine-specific IIC component